MGYSLLSTKRKVQSRHIVAVEKVRSEKESMPKQDCVPAYGTLFAFIVSLCTCSIASVFFAYKWFSCLNYLVGKYLFKPCSLTVIWTVLFMAGIGSILFESFWVLVCVWVGHVAVVVYLLVQLRRCRTYPDHASRRQKIAFTGICLLFLGSAVLIVFCDKDVLLVCTPVLAVIETCMIQWMFNIVVCEALGSRDLWNAKKSDDLQKLRVAVIWYAIGLSVALFFWDILDTVLRITDINYLHYHDFSLHGEFQMWLFFEEYCPHACWQLCLWCVALLIGKMPLGFISRCGKKVSDKIKGCFAGLFPNVTKK